MTYAELTVAKLACRDISAIFSTAIGQEERRTRTRILIATFPTAAPREFALSQRRWMKIEERPGIGSHPEINSSII